MSHRASGEGSIGKRKDGTYYGAIRLDGQRHWAYGEIRREVADKFKAGSDLAKMCSLPSVVVPVVE